MKEVCLVVDSTADVTEEVRKALTVVPLTIHFGAEEYVDGVTIQHHTFYEKLVESDVLPTTSQPTPDAFERIYIQALAKGQEVVVLTISAKLSGTCQSATLAAQEYPGQVYVVDSQTAALGTGILAELALQLVQAGKSAQEIAQTLEIQRERVRLIALLDTLEYLQKGGRISRTAAFAGNLLSIKPVICVRKGAVEVLGKARGSRQGNNLLMKEIETAGGIDFDKPLLLGYTGLSDALLQKYAKDSAALWQDHMETLPSTIIGSVIGTHAGPGAVGVAFFSKK